VRRDHSFAILDRMSKALTKRSKGSIVDGAIPAVASGFIPGLGQLLNGEGDKALGVFAVAVITGASFLTGLPLIGGLFGLIYIATWLYGVGDGYIQGRRKS
jgi:TM2 domain-containing membrane protein YozV